MPDRRELYRSPNGDSWFLGREPATGHAFIIRKSPPSVQTMKPTPPNVGHQGGSGGSAGNAAISPSYLKESLTLAR